MRENKDIFADAFGRHQTIIRESAKEFLPEIRRAAEILLKAVNKNCPLFVCGNGGSAADAQHLAAEWICRYKKDRRPLAAVALTTNTSVFTAIGNDYGFEKIFQRQIEALGKQGDVLVVITTSGRSPNVLRAIKAAKKKKMKVIALTGAKGAPLKKTADAAIVVPSEETARIQEVHELIYHSWCEYIDSKIPKK